VTREYDNADRQRHLRTAAENRRAPAGDCVETGGSQGVSAAGSVGRSVRNTPCVMVSASEGVPSESRTWYNAEGWVCDARFLRR
jgi:hypothetical protein